MDMRKLSDEQIIAIAKKGQGGGGTSDYNSLLNKPQIGGVILQGNKSLQDLGIASADDLQDLADVVDSFEPFSRTVLWETEDWSVTETQSDLTLSEPYTDYDAVEIIIVKTNSGVMFAQWITTADFSLYDATLGVHDITTTSDVACVDGHFTTTTNFLVTDQTSQYKVKAIIGLKFGGGGGVVLDTEMSDTSTHAVQNKVIKEYVDAQIAAITDYESEVFPNG